MVGGGPESRGRSSFSATATRARGDREGRRGQRIEEDRAASDAAVLQIDRGRRGGRGGRRGLVHEQRRLMLFFPPVSVSSREGLGEDPS
ncbi:hypothetical protein NL676_009597 [Syzygium grande]|nr:hypothetical protein NL676_009597 [Syzygium grande]